MVVTIWIQALLNSLGTGVGSPALQSLMRSTAKKVSLWQIQRHQTDLIHCQASKRHAHKIEMILRLLKMLSI